MCSFLADSIASTANKINSKTSQLKKLKILALAKKAKQ